MRNFVASSSTCLATSTVGSSFPLPLPKQDIWTKFSTADKRALDVGVGHDGWKFITSTNNELVIHHFGNRWDIISGFWSMDGGYNTLKKNILQVDTSAGAIAFVDQNNDIFHQVVLSWVQLPGKATDVGVGANGQICKVGNTPVAGGFDIACLNAAKTEWVTISGGGVRISVKPDGMQVVVNDGGAIYERNADNTGWDQLNGAAIDIAVGGDGIVWVLGTDHQVYQKIGSIFLPAGGIADRISVDSNGMPWVVTAGGELFEFKVTG